MTIETGRLCLDSTTRRRVGLTRGGYTHAPLLQSLNASKINSPTPTPAPMAPKTAPKRAAIVEKSPLKEDTEKDIDRMPDSSSDEDGPDPSDIVGTDFGPPSSKPEAPATQEKLAPSKKGKASAEAKNKSAATRKGTRSTNEVPNSSASSIGSSSSTKRKGEEQPTKLGAGITDEFGQIIRTSKKVKRGYGIQKGLPRVLPPGKKRPKEKLKNYPSVEDSPRKSDGSRLKAFSDIESSPESTPQPAARLKQHAEPEASPDKNEPKLMNKYDDLSDSDDDATKSFHVPHESPAKPSEGSKSYSLGVDSDLLSTAKAIIDKDRDELAPATQSLEDYEFVSMTQRACCPMCGATVDPEDIRAYSKNGIMNIRTQEKFCRSHKTRTAQDDWEIKSYPTIDWDSLDTRISKHHTFIKKMINGQNSHYRGLWDEKVTAGKDRNLKKMSSNLTPGYYGARGLRVFSENIMRKFTPLLQKRMPQDPLMSARGFTAYVQSVLVPEVAVKLIMEDMGVKAEEGRQILADSVDLGELLNEEIRDVVTRKVVDSEGEDESD